MERPIIFSGPMVRAILAGTKTQTRRIVKPVRGYEHNNICRPDMAADPWVVWWHGEYERVGCLQTCPYGVPGNRLYVKETWRADDYAPDDPERTIYQADGPADLVREVRGVVRWRPSIFMPRSRYRVALEVTSVRVQRLQDISEEDAQAEGATYHDGLGVGHSGWRHDPEHGYVYATAKGSFSNWWNATHARKATWASNPWVWALTFKVCPK